MHRYTKRSLAWLVSIGCGIAAPNGWAGAADCWVDIYDKSDFQGAHVRIQGPAELPKLSNLDGADWGGRIESLAVGNQAEVFAYRNPEFRDDTAEQPAYHGEAIKAWGERPETYSGEQISFGPGKREHHLGELNFHRNINSLKVRCRN